MSVPRPRLAESVAALVLACLCACGPGRLAREAVRKTGGDPDRGEALLGKYGCGTCHTISEVPGARGLVGPALDGIAGRAFLAGRLPNTPANLIRWIRAPRSIERGTTMPDLGVSEQDGRDLAAFLYTLD